VHLLLCEALPVCGLDRHSLRECLALEELKAREHAPLLQPEIRHPADVARLEPRNHLDLAEVALFPPAPPLRRLAHPALGENGVADRERRFVALPGVWG